MTESLGIELAPLATDPLLQRYGAELPAGTQPWEPWPASLAAQLFLAELERLVEQRDPDGTWDFDAVFLTDDKAEGELLRVESRVGSVDVMR